MANSRKANLLFLFFSFIWASQVIQGSRIQILKPHPQRVYHIYASETQELQDSSKVWTHDNARRLMIGSVAPTCTYNECRGCKFKCRAEQVPVEGNDPINSAYHYKCICHRIRRRWWWRRRKVNTIRLGKKRRGFSFGSRRLVHWGVVCPFQMLKKIIADITSNGQLIEACYGSLIILRPQLFPLC